MFFGPCGLGRWESLGYSNCGFPGVFSVWGWIGFVLGLVFWIGLLGVFTILVMRAARRARVQAHSAEYAARQLTAEEILKSRYAQSEISREQYEQMKRDIE